MPGSGPGVAGKPYHQIVNRLLQGAKVQPMNDGGLGADGAIPSILGSSFGSSVG